MSMSRMRRSRALVAPVLALAIVTLVGTACSSAAGGQGQGSGTPFVTQPATTTASSPSAAPTTSAQTSASESPSSSASSSSSNGAASCSDATYCDSFDTAHDAWASQNTDKYFVGWSNYLGGTFRMTERHASTLPQAAPFDISKASPSDNVVVDVNAVVGGQSPIGSEYGVTCWNQRASNGGTSAFTFFFGSRGAEIGLWGYTDGSYHQIKAVHWSNVLQPAPYENKVRAICVHGQDKYGTIAKLGLAVNGHTVIATYAESAKNYEWKTSNQVGLLVSGTAADVFYDNFGVRSY